MILVKKPDDQKLTIALLHQVSCQAKFFGCVWRIINKGDLQG